MAAIGLVIVLIPAMMHIGEVFREDPFASQAKIQVVTPGGRGNGAAPNLPLIDRVFGGGGVLLLRLAVVALAAFMAGATVQRISAADFAGRFGPFELRKLSSKTVDAAAASSTTIAEVARRLDRQMAVTRKAARLAGDVARRVDAVELRLPPE